MKSPTYQQQYRQKGLSTRKLLMLSSIVFVSAIAVSATSTYAFYSLTEKFRIANLSITVDAGSTPTFKLRAEDKWGNLMGEKSSYSLANFGYDKPTLGNISNMFHKNYPTAYQNDFLPYFYDGYHNGSSTRETNPLTWQRDGSVPTDYIQMVFQVECSEDAYLFLSSDTEAKANDDANRQIAGSDSAKFDRLSKVTEATRISFYSPYGYVISELGEEHEDVTYAGKLDIDGDGYYDANADHEEILYGSYQGAAEYDPNPPEFDDATDIQEHEPNVFYAKSRGQKDEHGNAQTGNRKVVGEPSAYGAETELAHPLKFYAADSGGEDIPFPYTYHPEDDEHPELKNAVAVAQGGKPTRLVVTVYLEGWDHDMTSDLIEACFDFKLGFVAVFDPAAKKYFH